MNTLVVRLGRVGMRLPASMWRRVVRAGARRAGKRLESLSSDHRRVRDFTVTEIIGTGRAVAPERIAEGTGIPADRIPGLLEDLERAKVFLFRSDGSSVNWAYPVTAEETPHRIRLETGERCFASSALDAIALPLVHAGLTDPDVCVVVGSACACCERPIELILDGELGFRVLTEEADPVISVPLVDVTRIAQPSIIKEFSRRSLFFWSTEHVGHHRERISGLYPGIEQATAVAEISHSELFELPR